MMKLRMVAMQPIRFPSYSRIYTFHLQHWEETRKGTNSMKATIKKGERVDQRKIDKGTLSTQMSLTLTSPC